MLLLIRSGESLDFQYIFLRVFLLGIGRIRVELLLFPKGQNDLLYLLLIVLDMRIIDDKFHNITLGCQRIDGLALGFWK